MRSVFSPKYRRVSTSAPVAGRARRSTAVSVAMEDMPRETLATSSCESKEVTTVFDKHVRRKSLSTLVPLGGVQPSTSTQSVNIPSSTSAAGGTATGSPLLHVSSVGDAYRTTSDMLSNADNLDAARRSFLGVPPVSPEVQLRSHVVVASDPQYRHAVSSSLLERIGMGDENIDDHVYEPDLAPRVGGLKIYQYLATLLTVACIASVVLAQAAVNERVVPLLVSAVYTDAEQTAVLVVMTVIAGLTQWHLRKRSTVCDGGTRQYTTITVVLMVVVHSVVKDIARDENAGTGHVYIISKPQIESSIIPAGVGLVKVLTLVAYGAVFARLIPYLSSYSTYKIGGVVGATSIVISIAIGYLPFTWPPLFHQNLYNVFLGSLSFFYFAREYIQTKSDAIAERHKNIANYCYALAAMQRVNTLSTTVETIANEADSARRLTLTDEYILELEHLSGNLKKQLKRPSGSDQVASNEIETSDF